VAGGGGAMGAWRSWVATKLDPTDAFRRSAQKDLEARIAKSPTLSAIEIEGAGLGAAMAAVSAREPWRLRLFTGFLAAAGLFLVVSLIAGWGLVPFFVVLYGGEFLVLFPMRNRVREYRLALNYVELVEHLERHPQRWIEPAFRGSVNKKIERVAREIERIPRPFHAGDAVTREWLRTKALGAATGIRELKKWTVTPTPLTYTDLLARFASDLRTVVAGRWEELPQATVPQRKPRSRIATVAYVIAALLVLAAAVASPLLGARYGDRLGGIAGTAFSVAAVFFLSRAGVPTSALADAADVADKVRAKA
jgi:hypothetical protein